MNTDTSEKPVFQEFEKNIDAHKFYRNFIIENSIFFNYQLLFFSIFGIMLPLIVALSFGIKWLWLAVAYVIFHAVISEKIRDKLDGKFIDEHPVEAIAHFGR